MLYGLIFIFMGVLINQWTCSSVLYLQDGQISLLRVAVIWLFDLVCICMGIHFIVQKKTPVCSFKKLMFAGMMSLLLLLFSEGLLQLAVCLSSDIDRLLSNTYIPQMISDPILGHRPNPAFPGHDSNGFRNKAVLSQADLVTIGDSQTYGTNVQTFLAWPHQLGQLSKQSVYNISFGGYGAVEGLLLFENYAIQLAPKRIIFMLYDGNDYTDAYDAVYNQGLYDSLKSNDKQVLDSIALLHEQDPLMEKVKAITVQLWSKNNSSTAKNPPGTQDKVKKQGLWKKIKQLKLLKLFFAVERTLQATFIDIHETYWKRAVQAKSQNSNLFEFFQDKDFRTIFTPSYRAVAMNIDDIRLQEGHRITMEAIRLMKELADKESIDFLVLLLPIKESVFQEYFVHEGHEMSEAFQTVIEMQSEIRFQNLKYLKQYGIPYLDMLPVLQNCIKEHQQPYFIDYDGHINAIGHRAVAETVNLHIAEKVIQ